VPRVAEGILQSRDPAQHQFSKGLTFVANYTYSKVITDGWEGGGSTQSQIASCRACDRGPTSYNNPRHFVVSAIYELPFGRGRMFGSSWNRMTDLLVGGWAVNAIATFSTGTTFHSLRTESHGK